MENTLLPIFLGNTAVSKPVGDGMIALTRYSDNIAFEEWHSHENASISLLVTGTHGEYLDGKYYKRMPGDIKFIPAGLQHRCHGYVTGTQKINLDISRHLLKDMGQCEDTLFRQLRDDFRAKFALLKLYHAVHDRSNHAQVTIQLLLYELMGSSIVNIKKKISQPPIWVGRLKQLLNDQWDTPFNLNDLATATGVHPVTISKYFPQYFGSTLSSYLISIKVERSVSLIKTTGLSLTDIAYTCGFADQAHFTRSFKEYTGFLPKDFRKI